MKHPRSMKNILAVVLSGLLLFSGAAMAQDHVEKHKIDFLISSVEHSTGAKFIRNGSEYDGKDAAEHLKMKRDKVGRRVQTADDFIRLCASKSFVTGKSYLIRLPDGKLVRSETYLREKLKEFNAPAK